MPQLITPKTKVTVTPYDGGIEITLNIHITVDGGRETTDTFSEKVPLAQFIPDFSSSPKIGFGKTDKGEK